jgi:hypothetical protein
VDWAEIDGRKRRGGRKAPAGKKGAPAKTVRGKRGEERAPRPPARARVEAPALEATLVPPEAELPFTPGADIGPEAERPARAHDRAGAPRAREAAPRMRPPREAARREEPGRDEAKRDEAKRVEPRRDEPRREASRDRPPIRDERSSDHRRERWRQDDLGPAVVGFGDDVPAFMLVRRRPAPAPLPESDA